MSVKALVLTGYGLNCDFETAHVLKMAGAQAERVHISDLAGTVKRPPCRDLEGFSIIVFVGGFAWGDDHGAGVLLATRLGNHLHEQLRAFLDRGGLVLGICNGFQALVNLGLLPGLDGKWDRKIALAANDCGNFQDRWVDLIAEPKSPCIFTRGMEKASYPVRHGEGKLVASEETLKRLEDEGLVALRYAKGKKPAQGKWPYNPNGSSSDIAGVCDPTGRVFGLMPHPEAHYRLSCHPRWTLLREKARRKGRELDPYAPGPGLVIFENAVAEAERIAAEQAA